MQLLPQLRVCTIRAEELQIFREFRGKLVSKSLGGTSLGPKPIAYDQLPTIFVFMAQWSYGYIDGAFRK